MVLRILDLSFAAITSSIWLFLLVFCIYFPQPNTGYIINDEGHLVPFKIFKKGGSRMCFLHPMNCRGGVLERVLFHKRGLDESLTNTADEQYEIPTAYKRSYPGAVEEAANSRNQMADDVAIFYKLNHDSNMQAPRDIDLLQSMENRNFDEQNELSNAQTAVRLNRPKTFPKYSVGRMDLSRHRGDYQNDITTVDLENILLAGGSIRGSIAEPPPLDMPELKAEILDYPSYEILKLENEFNPSNTRDVFIPSNEFETSEYRKRRRRR